MGVVLQAAAAGGLIGCGETDVALWGSGVAVLEVMSCHSRGA